MITGTSALILERDIIIKEQKAEIERLKALLVRAADALEASKWDWHQARLLVDELRKAAQ